MSASYYPALSIGGPVVAVHELNRSLVSIGLDLTVFTTNAHVENIVTADQEQDVDGVRVTYFSFDKRLEWLGGSGWQYSPALVNAFKKRLKEFDLLHIVGVWNYPSVMMLRLASRYNMPVLLSPHGSLKPEHFRTKAWKKWLYYQLLVKPYLGRHVTIQYFTEEEKQESTEYFHFKASGVAIANGIFLPDISPRTPQKTLETLYKGKTVILFLGRLHSVKGLEFLMDAFAKLVTRCPSAYLVVAGEGHPSYVAELKARCDALKLQDHMTFLGLVKGESKQRILELADIYVLPSYNEAFSMSILEAMAYQLPIVISDRCYFSEIESNQAGYVLMHDQQQWMKSLDRLLTDESLRCSMGEKAKALVASRYRWDIIAETYKSCFQHMFDERGSK